MAPGRCGQIQRWVAVNVPNGAPIRRQLTPQVCRSFQSPEPSYEPQPIGIRDLVDPSESPADAYSCTG